MKFEFDSLVRPSSRKAIKTQVWQPMVKYHEIIEYGEDGDGEIENQE